jgi:transcriptional regulator with XRE-family HTH domain/anti-sigma regulatory factor (Ser/Thr protein kinase)
MSDAQVVSLAERLKRRREELGLSQAQAARELDVARTAYRLWEMEAAKPQPDRWRLLSRWLGVSVTTMLLADELEEGSGDEADVITQSFDRVGRDWNVAPTDPAEFFARAHRLIEEGTEKGFISADHAEELLATIRRIEQERVGSDSEPWEPARLAKELTANKRAPKAARDAVAFVAGDAAADSLRDAQLLVSELVTNSVVHGSTSKHNKVGILIDVNLERLRVEVTDLGEHSPELGAPHETGGYGLYLVDRVASRWETTRVGAGNLTWFEIDLVGPGAMPDRR